MTTPKVRVAWPIGFTPADIQRAQAGPRGPQDPVTIATGNVIGVVDDDPGEGTWHYRIGFPSQASPPVYGPYAAIHVAAPGRVVTLREDSNPISQATWQFEDTRPITLQVLYLRSAIQNFDVPAGAIAVFVEDANWGANVPPLSVQIDSTTLTTFTKSATDEYWYVPNQSALQAKPSSVIVTMPAD